MVLINPELVKEGNLPPALPRKDQQAKLITAVPNLEGTGLEVI
jgi:hypothetical protein